MGFPLVNERLCSTILNYSTRNIYLSIKIKAENQQKNHLTKKICGLIILQYKGNGVLRFLQPFDALFFDFSGNDVQRGRRCLFFKEYSI